MARYIRKATLAVSLLLISFLLTACTIPGTRIEIPLPSLPDWLPIIGGRGGESSGPVSLTYWGVWEPPAVIQPLIEEYQAQHPNISIEYEQRDPRQHFQTSRARLQTATPPDIIRVHATWVPFLFPFLAPLPSQVMSNADYAQKFFPVTQELLLLNKQYYGLPLGIDGLALVYNLDLFSQAGLTQPPATWETLRQQARQLTRKDADDNITQAGIALGYSNIDYFSDILGLMFAQNEVRFVDEKGRVMFHQSLASDGRNLGTEALTFYTLFASSEKTYSPAWPNSTAAFTQGKVAMILIPSHRILEILGGNPQLRFGVAPAPQLPGAEFGSGREINWANFWVEAVAKNSPHSQEAWRFLKFLSEKQNLITLYKNASQLRSFGEPFPRNDMQAEAQTDQFIQPYTEQGPSYTGWFFAFGTHDDVLNDRIVGALKEMVDNISLRQQGIEGELKAAATRVQKILDDNQPAP